MNFFFNFSKKTKTAPPKKQPFILHFTYTFLIQGRIMTYFRNRSNYDDLFLKQIELFRFIDFYLLINFFIRWVSI